MKKSALYIILFLLILTSSSYSGQIKNGGGTTIGGGVTSGTPGSMLFIDGSGNLGQDNTNFKWDTSLLKLQVGQVYTAAASDSVAGLNIGADVTGGDQAALVLGSSFSAQGEPLLITRSSRGTMASPAASANADRLLTMDIYGYASNSGFFRAVQMEAAIDGVPNLGIVPGRLSFRSQSNADASGTLRERMRITSVGVVDLAALDASTGVGIAGQLEVQGNVFLPSGSKEIAYNGIATVSNGHPAEYATVDLTTPQTAAIAATTAYAVPSSGAGMYRVSYVAKVTTAAGTSSVLGGTNGFQVRYTDADDSVVTTTAASVTTNLNSTQAQINGSIIVNAKASTNIQYIMGYTSVPGIGSDMAYTLHLKFEAL